LQYTLQTEVTMEAYKEIWNLESHDKSSYPRRYPMTFIEGKGHNPLECLT